MRNRRPAACDGAGAALAGWLAAWSLPGLFVVSGTALLATAAGAAAVRQVRAIE